MPINKETIISVFDDKLTLMQWLKTINKALEDAVLTGVEITKKGNATLSFKFTFEDGTFLETNDIVLQQGESVNGAYIQNGHLYLTLTNGTNLDAGNVKPVSSFSINASGHLIVNYGDGTSQDLGSLGDFSNVDFVAKTLKQTNANYSSPVSPNIGLGLSVTDIYSRVEEINNVLYIVFNYSITNNTGTPKTGYSLGTIYVSLTSDIAEKVIDLNGHPASIADSESCLILSFNGICLDNNKRPLHEIFCEVKNTATRNQIIIQPSYGDGVTWQDGETKYFTGRVFLTLL